MTTEVGPDGTSTLSRNAGFDQSADETHTTTCSQLVLAVCPLLALVFGWSDGLHSQGAPTASSWTWVGRRAYLLDVRMSERL